MLKKIIALLCVITMLCLTSSILVFAEEENILLGKTVTFNEGFGWVGDAESNNLRPDKLVDGDESTFCAVINPADTATLGGDNQIWFKVDLGAVYDLNKVELVCRTAEQGWSSWDMDYVGIMVSSTDVAVSQMTEVARTKGYWDNGGELEAGGTYTKDLSISARYIAIYADNRASAKMFACAEWRAYGVRNNNIMAGVAPTEVTGNFTVIPSFTPENVTDGDISTICYSFPNTNPSFKYDLGETHNIKKVEIYARTQYGAAGEAGGVEIYGSKFNVPIESMSKIATTPIDLPLGGVFSYTLPEVREYRYFALKCSDERKTSPSANGEFIIAEFKVFDTEEEAVPELIEPFETNVAQGKTIDYNEELDFISDDYGPAKLNDGIVDAPGAQNIVYMLTSSAASQPNGCYFIIDLENAYFINRLQLIPRITSDNPDALSNIRIVGSLEKVPVSEMEVITNTGSAGAAEWNYTLDTAKKYRYIGLAFERNAVFECSEFRAFSYADAEYSAWSVKNAGTNTEVTNIAAGSSYDVSINVKNNYINGAPTYIMLIGGYDAQGFMTTIECKTVTMPPAPTSSTLTASNIYMPAGTVKMTAALLDSMENAYMVVESCDLTAAAQ